MKRARVAKAARRAGWLGLHLLLGLCGSAAPAHALGWPDVAERVERDLSAGDVAARRAAAHALSSLGPARGSPLALTAMSDPDDEVRLAAAEAAMRFRASAATDVATAWLNAPDARLRREACEVARSLPSARAIAPLARSLGDPDAEVRAAAADALGHQASPDAVAPLLGRLDDSTPAVRIAIVGALARLDDPRAVVPLVGKVEDSAADVRQAVVRALGDMGDARASSALVLALRDQSSDVRREALAALGRLRSADAVDAIAPFVSDRLASLRVAALDALGRIATPDALRAMTAALGAGDDEGETLGRTPVRDAFVAAGERAVAPLHALLAGSPSPAAATSAAWILGELKARAEAASLVAAMRRGTLPTAAGLHALVGAGTAAEVPVVLEFVDDPSPAVRAEAADAALALLDPNQPDGRAVEPLAAALRDARPSNEERARIALVLGRTGAPRAAAILGELAKAPDLRLRVAAIDALGTLGAGDADGPLLEAIASNDAEVRLHAAVALGDAGTARARDELLAKLDGADEVDRPAVWTALGGLLARAPTEAAVARLTQSVDLAAGPERDAVLDALGRMPLASAVAALANASRSSEPLDRSAAAQMCAAHAAQVDPAGAAAALAVARALLVDPDERVRAQAAWALGAIGTADDLPRLSSMARSDEDAAANATAAMGRISAIGRPRSSRGAPPELCALVSSPRVLVRANALVGVALAGARCGDGSAERLALASDPSDLVRDAAAVAVATAPGPEDMRALGRCARIDSSTVVARRCAEAPAHPSRTHATLVYVTPASADWPRPGAAYALRFADGLVRTGAADRRGAVFDPVAPEGQLRLVPTGGLSR
jgi:HEAT repeat protein